MRARRRPRARVCCRLSGWSGLRQIGLTAGRLPGRIPQVDDKSPHAVVRQVVTEVYSSAQKPSRESLIVHCLGRAYLAANGWDRSEEQAKAGALKVNQWKAARVAPKATRVALFIASWAAAMRAENREEYTITEYARFWKETERQAYRLQSEFRDLWPGVETPNELAGQIVKQSELKLEKDKRGNVAPFPVSVQVSA
jgi:hypothetical protein